MNIFKIIEAIEKVDPEMNDRFNPRRAAIKNITSFGSKIAIAALPFAMGTLFKRAYGQGIGDLGDVTGVLNYALKLEYLEAAFYNAGVSTAGLIPSGIEMTNLSMIRDHENNHVAFLKSVLGTAAVAQTSQGTNGVYDFTAKGTFPTVLTNYDTFLAVANAFEDTGVRAYKGQAPNVIGNQVVLTAALNIHSVEARHAAHIRQVRRSRTVPTLKPWISGSASVFNDTGIGSAADANYGASITANQAANYPAENNTVQGGVTVTTLPAVTGTTSITAAIEAFDEPLDYLSVVALVSPFGVK